MNARQPLRSRHEAPHVREVLSILLLGILLHACGCDSRSGLEKRVDALLVENAALEARLSMSKRSDAYLVADMENRMLNLELQGVILVSQPVHKAVMNRAARDLLSGRDRSGHLSEPYRLESDTWIESPRIQALRDSARVRPDTTGALREAIRTCPVFARLEFDRSLSLILEGRPMESSMKMFLARLRVSLGSLMKSASTRNDSLQTAEIRLLLSPADVRSLTPNIKQGSLLVVVP